MPIISNVVCPFCGCCCDDIKVIVKDNRIIDVRDVITYIATMMKILVLKIWMKRMV